MKRCGLGLVALMLLGACQAPLRPASKPPGAAEELRALDARLAAGELDQTGLLRRAQLALVFDRDMRRVRELLAQAEQHGPTPVEGALLGCQLEALERRYTELERRCIDVLERFPSRPEAEEAAAMVSLAFDQRPGADARIAAALTRAADRCDAGGEDVSCAGLAYLAGRARLTVTSQTKDAAGFASARSALGGLSTWRVCGPVAPADALGFRKLRAALLAGETAPASSATCVERTGAEAQLRPFAYGQRGAYLMETFVHAPRDSDATLFALLPPAALLLIDGHPVIDRDPWFRRPAAVQRVGLHIEAGWHRFALAAAPTSVDVGVAVFLIDKQGAPATAPAQLDAPAGAPLSGVTSAASADAATLLEAGLDPGAQPWRALRLTWLLGSDAYTAGDRARRVARDLTAAQPESGLAWLALAQAADLDPTLPARLRDSERRSALERALELRPEELLARYHLALLDYEQRPDEALARMRALVADRPDYPWGQRRLHDMLERRGLTVAARAPLQAALDAAPGETSLALAEPYYLRRGVVAAARAVAAARVPFEPVIASTRHADWLLERGEPRAALAAYDAVYALAPGAPGYSRVLELARRVEGWAEVAARAQARLDAFPHDAASAHWLLRAARASGDDAVLMQALDRAHAARPGDPRWERHRLRARGVDVDDAARFDSTALIAAFRAEAATRPELYEGHAYVYVLDAAARLFHRGGGSFLVTHQVIHIQGKEAASQLGEVGLAPGVERRVLRVIKADGRIVEPESAHASGDTSLSDLEPGDFLETRTVEERAPEPFEASFSERFYFASQVPIYLSTYLLVAPPAQLDTLTIHRVEVASPSREHIGERAAWRFEVRAVPAVRPEPFGGPPAEVLPHITVTRGVDLARYAREAARRLAQRSAVNDDVVAFARAASRGRRGDRPRLMALAAAVVERVPVSGADADPAIVLGTGRGDRLSLLRAAALAIGLDARLVGVHRASPLPLVDWADSALAEQVLVVRVDGEELPVTSIGAALSVGGVAPNLRDGLAVEIDPAAADLGVLGQSFALPENWLQETPQRMEIDAHLDHRGALKGTLEMTLQAPLAGVVRSWVRTTPRRRVEQTIETWLGAQLPGLALERLELPGLDDEQHALRFKAGFSVERYAQRSGGALVVDRFLPGLSLTLGGESAEPAAYLRVAERRTALYLEPHFEQSRVRITLPEGAHALTLPARFDEQGRFGRYAQRARSEAGAIVVEREVAVPFTRVPAEAYGALRALGERVANRTPTQLTIPLAPRVGAVVPGGRPTRSVETL